MATSLKPSTFTNDPAQKNYGEYQNGYKVHSRYSVHPFDKIMRRVSRGSSASEYQREISREVVKDGFCFDVILELGSVTEVVDDLSLKLDDRHMDTVLKPVTEYAVERIDRMYSKILMWNEKVKDDLCGQAFWCGMDSCLYVQLMIFRHIVNKLDYQRDNHLKAMDFGASEKPMREAVEDFERWLKFRLTILNSVVEKYQDISTDISE